MNASSHLLRLLSVLVAAVVLASGIAACGDSDDGGSDGASAPAMSTTDDRAADTGSGDSQPEQSDTDQDAGGSGDADSDANAGAADDADEASGDQTDEPEDGGQDEEERVAAVVSGMYSDFAAADAAGVCSVMTELAQKQIAGSTPGKEKSCESGLGNFLSAAKQSGALKQASAVKVGAIKVNGDTATVTISLAGRKGQIQLVKQGGAWLFGNTPVGAQPAK